MNEYHIEHLQTFEVIANRFATLDEKEIGRLREMAAGYFVFRNQVDDFFAEHFGGICTENCYRSRVSACCTREGIIAFFADVVINVLVSEKAEIESLMAVLRKPNHGFKCVYLGEAGCMWRIKPVICEMFLCDPAKNEAFAKNPSISDVWDSMKEREKRFRWPDRPVLFDDLEKDFMKAGYDSPLMYLNNSPGLLRLKQKSPGYLDSAHISP